MNITVLDVKSYFPAFDCIEKATVPGWVGPLMTNYF